MAKSWEVMEKQGCGIWEKGQADGVYFCAGEAWLQHLSAQERAGLRADFCSMLRATLCPPGFNSCKGFAPFISALVFICSSASSHCSCPAVPLQHRPEQGKPHAGFSHPPCPAAAPLDSSNFRFSFFSLGGFYLPPPSTPKNPKVSCTQLSVYQHESCIPSTSQATRGTFHHKDSPVCNKLVK